MSVKELIGAIQKKTKTSLNEAEAKALLKEYGVPVVPEAVVADYNEAISVAKELGYPVVIKGLGSALAHKTERGLVHLNLSNPQDIQNAVNAIILAAGDDLDGLLIQPQIQGKREWTRYHVRHRGRFHRSFSRCYLSIGADHGKRCCGYADRNQGLSFVGEVSGGNRHQPQTNHSNPQWPFTHWC
jgi:hypothetical protein